MGKNRCLRGLDCLRLENWRILKFACFYTLLCFLKFRYFRVHKWRKFLKAFKFFHLRPQITLKSVDLCKHSFSIFRIFLLQVCLQFPDFIKSQFLKVVLGLRQQGNCLWKLDKLVLVFTDSVGVFCQRLRLAFLLGCWVSFEPKKLSKLNLLFLNLCLQQNDVRLQVPYSFVQVAVAVCFFELFEFCLKRSNLRHQIRHSFESLG